MMTHEEVTALLDQLVSAPHDRSVRSAVDAALSEIDDDNQLASILDEFRVELPVAEAVERRLLTLNSANSRAWGNVARTLLSYCDTLERQQHALDIIRRSLATDANNVDALHTAILVCSFMSNPPREELMDWSKRRLELEPEDFSAISARAKVLLKLGEREAALAFLREQQRSGEVEPVRADELPTLIRQIEAGENVLRQWP